MSALHGPDIPQLEELERRYTASFARGRAEGLRVIGYGEITSVVSWPPSGGGLAVKRLPVFPDPQKANAYLELLAEYLRRLREVNIAVLPTASHVLNGPGDGRIVYLAQDQFPAEAVGPALLQDGASGAAELFATICRAAARAAAAGIGFDAQVSNWVRMRSELGYLDVTTPLLRNDAGEDLLDSSVFTASLPWPARTPVRRFLAPGIMAEYFDLRIVLLNMLANLHKERLAHLIPIALDVSNEHVDRPIERPEVDRYYRKDAFMWEALQRLRRMDRAWQLKIRRRPYPVLLPDKIKR